MKIFQKLNLYFLIEVIEEKVTGCCGELVSGGELDAEDVQKVLIHAHMLVVHMCRTATVWNFTFSLFVFSTRIL